jgi:hypothetical protein
MLYAKFTPKVIARIEYFQPLLGKSYLICQKLEADFNMQAPLFKNHPNKQTIFGLYDLTTSVSLLNSTSLIMFLSLCNMVLLCAK